MKKTWTLEFDKCSLTGSDKARSLKTIIDKFYESFLVLGEFIIQQIFNDNKPPERLELYLEIWRGLPMKRGIKIIIEKGSLDKIKKYQRFQVISRMFLSAYQAMGELCVERICRGKREPKKIVIIVEVK